MVKLTATLCCVLILLWSLLALLFSLLTPASGLTVTLIVSGIIGYPYLLGLMLTVSSYRWLQKNCKGELREKEIDYESRPEEERDGEEYERTVQTVKD